MKKIIFILILFFFFICLNNVNAEEYIVYSDWSEEYPSWLDDIFIQQEERYLWYKEVVNNETNEIEIEKTTEYYKELDGYKKIEESMKVFYRYVTNNIVLFDRKGNLIYDSSYCDKEYCIAVEMPEKPDNPPPEVIDNPKTYDNIFVFLILSFISFVSIVLIVSNRKINLVLSKQMKNI